MQDLRMHGWKVLPNMQLNKRWSKKPTTVSAYIAAAPKRAQPRLRELRRIIKSVAPKAEEKISYAIPYYGFHGRLIYFAAFADHIGVYIMRASQALAAQDKAFAPYRKTRATLHFPTDIPIPVILIKKLVRVQMKANEAKK